MLVGVNLHDDKQLNVYETFIGIYQIKETTGDALCKLLLNVLLEK